MKAIERQGNDIQQIINDFKAEYGLDDFDFSYQIIQDSQKGFLGVFGNKKAIIHFKICNLSEEIQEYLKEFLIYVQVTVDEINIKSDEKYIYVDLLGVPDAGILIGKDGRFLNSLQYLLNQTFSSKDPKNRALVVDVENYKERQKMIMVKKVQQLAAQVLKNKKKITLDPMSALQRRNVHHALKNMPNIRTMTMGEGAMKRIVLCHAKSFSQEDNKMASKRKDSYSQKPRES